MADDVPICDRCGQKHVTRFGHQACTGHKGRDVLVPCRQPPKHGQRVCGFHGGSAPQNLAAAARAIAEANATATVQKLIPDQIEPIRDPILTLARLAGEADAVRGSVAKMLDKLAQDELWSTDKAGAHQLHALVTLYERWWTNTARSCEGLVRSNYLERHAAIEEAQVVALLTVVQRGLDLIPDLDLRRRVSTAIGAGLKQLPHAS